MSYDVTADDMDSEALCASVSRSTFKLLTIEAQRLGLSRAEYIELAIRTATPGNSVWDNAWQKISVINEARKSMARLKRAISWQQKMQPQDSAEHKQAILDDLARNGLNEQEVSEQLQRMGVVLSA